VIVDAPLSTTGAQRRAAAHVRAGCGSRGMAGGQAIDLARSASDDAAELERMHSLKTGALIRASILMGAGCGEPLDAGCQASCALSPTRSASRSRSSTTSSMSRLVAAARQDRRQGRAAEQADVRQHPRARCGEGQARAAAHEARDALAGAASAPAPAEMADFIILRKH
jgi:farnesyl diphosphate synthase